MSDGIESLREQIRALDRDLVALTARRLALARRVGELKQSTGQPIRNYAVEAEALRLVRDVAEALGVRPALAEELLKLEIRESLRVQEKDRVARARPARPVGSALVVGGAGNMGRWFVEFLESKGYLVAISDPRGATNGRRHVPDPAEDAAGFDLVLVATPPSAASAILESLQGRTEGVVMDIASLKSPVEAALRRLAKARMRVTSLHPMWGPTTELLASRNLVVCDVGVAEANAFARGLFADTAANVVDLPLDAHDRFMAETLGLPHAVNLLFGHALAAGGLPHAELAPLGGPTFEKQTLVTREVAAENKDLYHEIQALNPHTAEVLARLRRSLDEWEAAVGDRQAFRAYMARSERYFQGTSP